MVAIVILMVVIVILMTMNLSMLGILCVRATYKNRTYARKTAHLMLADQKMLDFNNRYYIGINIKLTIYHHTSTNEESILNNIESLHLIPGSKIRTIEMIGKGITHSYNTHM